MHKQVIQPKDWLHIHPCKSTTDTYYESLASQLYASVQSTKLPTQLLKRFCLYVAAYAEDLRSDLGLWMAFVQEHRRMYGRWLPFYELSEQYVPGEVNEEDIRVLLWNTWQKELQHRYDDNAQSADKGRQSAGKSHSAEQSPQTAVELPHPFFLNPFDATLLELAHTFYVGLADQIAEAPQNPCLANYFHHAGTPAEADGKVTWLFGHTYLTEPAMLPYIKQVAATDRFIVPAGPLALFVYEWLEALGADDSWKQVPDLYVEEPELSDMQKLNNVHLFETFLKATDGQDIVFLDGYAELRKFLIEGLHWPDDENHMLPQLAASKNFILMVNREKGMLLAKDVAEYLCTPLNPVYKKEEAEAHAFRVLSEEMLCPPDLLVRSIREGWLKDLSLPGVSGSLLVENADFLARCFLLYYYRGD